MLPHQPPQAAVLLPRLTDFAAVSALQEILVAVFILVGSIAYIIWLVKRKL
jgi:hypothetical protein